MREFVLEISVNDETVGKDGMKLASIKSFPQRFRWTILQNLYSSTLVEDELNIHEELS